MECPHCFSEVEPAGVPSGGRVAWWCQQCEALYPDDDYVSIRKRPLGMPR